MLPGPILGMGYGPLLRFDPVREPVWYANYLAVTCGGSIGECGRLSQPTWLLDAL